MKLPDDLIDRAPAQRVCRMLLDAGHQVYFVGGCVRDALLGRTVGDIDLTTDAVPDRVIDLAKRAGLKPVPTGAEHGTVTVVADGIPHEVTTLREDVETFGRHARVIFGHDILADARRRDFTMNALYAGPDGVVMDPLGDGIADLRDHRVRFIGDPVRRIAEDYLRILRFFRFYAWYGVAQLGPDADGLAAVAEGLDGLACLSRERTGAEMKKLLAAPDPAPAVAAMRASGVLAAILPGSDDRALAPLVHLEGERGLAPDPIRRLACLGGQDVADRLRLSRADARRRDDVMAAAGSTMAPAELGYRLGVEKGRDALLLRAALTGQALPPAIEQSLEKGAAAQFPVKAADLLPDLHGPALGDRLQELEDRWIASDFELTREELL